MGVKVAWSRSAAEDLAEALDFIANTNPEAARKLARQVRNAAKGLRLHPRKGRMVPERQDPSLRELILGPFRIIYSTQEPALVRILAAIRAERMLPEDLAPPPTVQGR